MDTMFGLLKRIVSVALSCQLLGEKLDWLNIWSSVLFLRKTKGQKFTDGGTYNPDEVKHYEQLYAKFIDRLAGAEKAVLEEARLIEGKRKSVMDTFVNKVTEKVPAHEADVAAVQTLTGLLARAQTSIKTQAALINVGYGNAKQALDRIRDEMNVMEKHLVSSKVVTENTLVALLDLVQEVMKRLEQKSIIIWITENLVAFP